MNPFPAGTSSSSDSSNFKFISDGNLLVDDPLVVTPKTPVFLYDISDLLLFFKSTSLIFSGDGKLILGGFRDASDLETDSFSLFKTEGDVEFGKLSFFLSFSLSEAEDSLLVDEAFLEDLVHFGVGSLSQIGIVSGSMSSSSEISTRFSNLLVMLKIS